MTIAEPWESDNAQRVTYDNERKQAERDRQRYAAFSAQYNNMAAPKAGATARRDDEEWDALNRGEAYYTQWMKNKFAREKAKQETKKRKRGMDERLLREWQQDARSKHERTVRKTFLKYHHFPFKIPLLKIPKFLFSSQSLN